MARIYNTTVAVFLIRYHPWFQDCCDPGSSLSSAYCTCLPTPPTHSSAKCTKNNKVDKPSTYRNIRDSNEPERSICLVHQIETGNANFHCAFFEISLHLNQCSSRDAADAVYTDGNAAASAEYEACAEGWGTDVERLPATFANLFAPMVTKRSSGFFFPLIKAPVDAKDTTYRITEPT